MVEEMKGHDETGTFSPMDAPAGSNVVSAKWVFSWKANELGQVVKAKARLVARGFSQSYEIDYDETFAPTPSSSSVKIIAGVANEHGTVLSHCGVSNRRL